MKPFPNRSTVQSALLGAVLASGAVIAQAGELCDELNVLVQMAQSNFAGAAEETPVLPGASECGVRVSLGGQNSYHCVWAFDYRAAGAAEAFDMYDGAIQGCFANAVRLAKDTSVNHPDFYDLRQYRLGGVEAAVSIKDKGALQQTFVFVRVIGAGGG